MAIVSDRKMIYERKIDELQAQLTEVSDFFFYWDIVVYVRKIIHESVYSSQEEPMDTDQSGNHLSSIQTEIAKFQLLIEEENQKLKRYKVCHRVLLFSYKKSVY